MPIVLDASVAVAWAFEQEDHPTAAVALDRIRGDYARVPALWWYEVRNALIVNERRNRLTPGDTAEFLQALDRLALVVDREPHEQTVIGFARQHGLTIYDAVYLELAQRHNVPLATLDTKLARAARLERVKLVEDGAA
jgi:predicted nucleic acid-binding protein